MKKVFLFSFFLLLATVFTISCSKENNIDAKVDYSILESSKLKNFVYKSKTIKDITSEELINAQLEKQEPHGPGCNTVEIEEHTTQSYSGYGLSIIEPFISKTYLFRDSKLVVGTGSTYKDVYYYFSSVLDSEEILYADVTKFINIIPTVENIYNRISDSNYTGVIINNNERDDIIEFIDYYGQKLNNDNVNIEIINAIKDDLYNLTNRDLEQIEGFLTQ